MELVSVQNCPERRKKKERKKRTISQNKYKFTYWTYLQIGNNPGNIFSKTFLFNYYYHYFFSKKVSLIPVKSTAVIFVYLFLFLLIQQWEITQRMSFSDFLTSRKRKKIYKIKICFVHFLQVQAFNIIWDKGKWWRCNQIQTANHVQTWYVLQLPELLFGFNLWPNVFFKCLNLSD